MHHLCTVIAKNVGTKNIGIWKILLGSGPDIQALDRGKADMTYSPEGAA